MKHELKLDSVISRYASPAMTEVFSEETRIRLWRKLWIALAQAERELGLKISAKQIRAMEKWKDRINWDVANKKEKEIRHEIMAHVHAYGSQAKGAAGIIHLGATSSYVTDNADLLRMREGLHLVMSQLASAIDRLGVFAFRERGTPTLALTHYQPAQPTTVGKRACLWIQDFAMDLSRLEFELKELRFHGCKGTTGTQDSFLKLFEGDRRKVLALDRLVTKKMGFEKAYCVTGQTYPRKVDTRIVTLLASICESASKFANDMRWLQAMHEVEEPREGRQVGSSAMPYKQNPMRCERIAALSRYVRNLVGNCFETAAVQGFERTLDDSANRRFVLPHAFLLTDGVLNLVINVAAGLRVHPAVIDQNLGRELPFLQTEEILMAGSRVGGDRQVLHERLRKHAEDVAKAVRETGASNDLLARLRKDPAFSKVPPKFIVKADPSRLTGLSQHQVEAFMKEVVAPVRRRYKKVLRAGAEVTV